MKWKIEFEQLREKLELFDYSCVKSCSIAVFFRFMTTVLMSRSVLCSRYDRDSV